MAFPSTIDGTAQLGQPAGTTLLATNPDHALVHDNISTAVTALENKMGLGAGSAAASQILTGSGAGTSVWSQEWDSGTLGTAVLKAPTINGAGTNSGTISGGMYGTATYQGGTANSMILNTPTVQQPWDNWIQATDIWVYASGTSFTIAGVDRTAIFTKGTRIKLTNNSVTDYGVVASSSFSTNTTVTLIGNTDYSLANSAITNPFYSYAENPQGYPMWFNYTVVWVGFSANPSNGINRFSVIGNTVFYNIEPLTLGTSNATTLTASLPVAASAVSSYAARGMVKVVDNGVVGNSPGLYDIAASATVVTFYKLQDTTAFTNSGSKIVNGLIIYEF